MERLRLYIFLNLNIELCFRFNSLKIVLECFSASVFRVVFLTEDINIGNKNHLIDKENFCGNWFRNIFSIRNLQIQIFTVCFEFQTLTFSLRTEFHFIFYFHTIVLFSRLRKRSKNAKWHFESDLLLVPQMQWRLWQLTDNYCVIMLMVFIHN